MLATRVVLPPQSLRFTATQSLTRTANLPDDIAFTLCGWARLVVDRNAVSVLAELSDAGSEFLSLETLSDGTTLQVLSDVSTGASITNLVVGQDFFWSIASSGLTPASTIARWRYAYQNQLTSVSPTGSNRAAQTPTTLRIADDGAGNAWNGRIWNVMCWNRALGTAELLAQSFNQCPVDQTSLNFWWRMVNGEKGIDWSDNQRNATVSGTLTAENSDVMLRNRRKRLALYAPAAGGGTAKPWLHYQAQMAA